MDGCIGGMGLVRQRFAINYSEVQDGCIEGMGASQSEVSHRFFGGLSKTENESEHKLK